MNVTISVPFTQSMRHGVDGSALPAQTRMFRVLPSKHDDVVHVGEKTYYHVSN